MQKIKNSIWNIFLSEFGKNIGIMFTESVMSRGLNFILIIILTRFLGPEEYGKYSLIFIIWSFCSQFIDFGMDNTVIRFSSKNNMIRSSILGLYSIAKIVIFLCFLVFWSLLGVKILALINKESIIPFIPFILLATFAESLLFNIDVSFVSNERFKTRSIINVARNLLNLIFVLTLVFLNKLTLQNVLYMYFITLAVSLLFIFKMIGFIKSFFQNILDRVLLKEIICYQKWMGTLAVSNTILQRLDIFIISILCSFAQIGIYNAAFQLCSVVSFLPYILSKVLLPKVSGLPKEELYDFIKKLYKPLSLFCLLIIILLPLADKIIPILLGNEYVSAIPVFNVFAFTFLITFLAVPIEQVLYSLGKPKIISVNKILQILNISVISFLTIPKLGIIGAAFAVLISRIFYIAALFLSIIKLENISLKDNEFQST